MGSALGVGSQEKEVSRNNSVEPEVASAKVAELMIAWKYGTAIPEWKGST